MKEKTLTKLTSHHFSAVLPLAEGKDALQADQLLSILQSAVAESRLTTVTDVTANFKPCGATAIVVLEESHVAVHLWPELGLVTVDIHVCDYSGDNESKAKCLASAITRELSKESTMADWKQLTIAAGSRRP